MSSSPKRKIILVLSAAILLLPLFALAQATITISPNLPGDLSTVSTSTSPGAYIQNFYQYALFISGFLAFAAIVYGGIKYTIARGNPSAETEAKQWIWSALLGLLLLAAAYLLLFTINPNLVNLELPTLPSVTATGPLGDPSSGGNGTGLSQAAAKAQLDGAGILVVSSQMVNGSYCSDRNNPNCTSLDGMQQSTISELLHFRNVCGCSVVVTGGTEQGHSSGNMSHANGYKVDISPNAGASAYIQNNYQSIGNRSSDGAPQYKDPATGVIFAREATHWDITVPGGS